MPEVFITCLSCGGRGQVCTGADGYGLPTWSTCPVCGGAGGTKRYVPDRQPSGRGGPQGRKTPPSPAVDPVVALSGWLGLIAGGGVFVLLLMHTSLAWYYALGAGGLLLLGINYLLRGPLRRLTQAIVTLLRWLVTLLGIALLAGVVWLLVELMRSTGG